MLGSPRFATAAGATGWGKARPPVIFNGGDPSGRAWKIRWSGWGSKSAIGYGLTSIFQPGGGYYGKPAEIELHAFALGRCVRGGPRAYTRLQIRVPPKPGGKLGRWRNWSGAATICHR
ncbi:MAG TPA: hypothetical protein VKR79_11145 [Gaiellaceae bacterium]|nr:hypothetical protein [Gaiellaceae bacterium]